MSAENQKIRIVIADDHDIFRQGFISMVRKVKSLEMVGDASDGEELVELVTNTKPDIAFVDIMMPKMDGITATKNFRDKSPNTKVIALSMFNDDNLIVDMLEAGASGYLLKNTTLSEIIMAATVVNNGEDYFCNETSKRMAKLIATSRYSHRKKTEVAVFTERELEVVQLMSEQLTTKEIAEKLNISPRTVENHRVALQEKTGSKNGVGVIIYAIKHNIITI